MSNDKGYDCAPGSVSILSSVPISGTRDLGNLATLTAGQSDNLKVSLELPSLAGNEFQGLKNIIGFTFDATQRTSTEYK